MSPADALASEARSQRLRIEIAVEETGMFFRTAPTHVRGQRLFARLAGVTCGIAGLVLMVAGGRAWGVLAIAGMAVFVFAPSLLRPTLLLRLDPIAGMLHTVQPEPCVLAVGDIAAIRGRYEVYGWEPRSVVYGEMPGSERVPLLVLGGKDEKLAIFACRALGALLDVPATCVGPFGDTTACFAPATVRA